MNYAGKFGSGTTDHFSSAGLNIDALGHQGGGDSVTIPDAHLLFSGDYSRSGADLIVSDQLHRVVVPNYFHGDKRPALLSPDGAPLDPSVIEAMTGHVQYAQAAGTAAAAAAKVVGHVVKMTGSASVVRNGVTITLNNGDTVLQNDVVQTGSGSSVGLVMIDGTTFNLSAGARLMLNDLTYDASSISNSSLFTLVQGAASFVAGQVAKTGDMKVGTPVATMGIRGTAVVLDISAVDGKVSISVIDQRDGQIHAVQVYNSRGVLIGTVTSNGSSLTLTPIANFEVIAQESNKTVAQIQQEFNIFNEALRLYEIQKAIDPNLPQHTENNANPRQYASLGSAPADSPQTVFHAPTGSGAPGQGAGGGTVAQIDFTPPPGGTGPGGSSSPQADPIPLQVVVQSAQLPFVVNPSTVPQISGDPGHHFGPVMSASGDVVYDPDGVVYFYDRETNTTIRVTPDDGFSYSGQTISSDGRYLVYQGTNGTDTFVYVYGTDPSEAAHYHQQIQLAAGTSPAISGDGGTILVEHGGSSIGIYNLQGDLQGTITAAAAGATGTVWKPSISADGHVMAFWTSDGATAGGAGHLFVYDVATGTVTEIASTATDAGTSAASFSADGRYVTYQSDAPGGHSEIYLYDLSTGEVIFHTANVAGASYNPVISPDGHFIVFASDAHLVPGDTNAFTDIYTVDLTDPHNPVYKLISVRPDGTPGDADSNLGAAISAGGKFVVFATKASNFSNDPDGGDGDIFISDPSSGRNTIIYETANSPSILHAQGVIELTGDRSGTLSIGVSDNSGRFTAGFDAHGNIVWNFNEARSDFDSLAYGQDSSQQFVITLTAGGNTTTIPVNVTVHNGVQPVITVVDAAPGAAPVALAQGIEDTFYTITAAALLAGTGDIDTPLSLLSITDVSIRSGGGSLHHNENGNWTYTPAADFNGPVVFNYTVSDGSRTASSTASLNIAGVNDDATISGQSTGNVVEDSGSTTGGTLTVQDVDSGEAHFQGVSVAALRGDYGNFTFNAGTGEWTYALDHGRADSLTGTDVVYDTLTVKSADGTSQDITVTVTGTNDAPEFTGHGPAEYVVGGPAVVVASGVFASDVDSDDYDGGSFTATVTEGGSQGDMLSVANNAFISVVSIASGHVVMFDADGDGNTSNAVAIGDLANNYGHVNSVTVALNGNATDAAVEALAQAIRFENGKQSAIAGTRTVTFTLHDGGGTANGALDSDFFETTVNVANPAAATTLTFDDLPAGGNDMSVPNGYGGFTWSNFNYLNASNYGTVSGYPHGVVSAPNVAYNAFGMPATVSGATFNFVGAYLTGAWNDGLSVTVVGYNHNVLVDQQTVVVNTDAPTWFEFDFMGVTDLAFSSSGGTNPGYIGVGTHFALDNFTFSMSVNHAATFSGQFAGSVVEDTSTTASGSLTVHDVDAGQSHFLPVSPDALDGAYGHFNFNAGSGLWNYTLNHEYADSLYDGQVVHDILTVQSADGTTQDITVTVHGVNDAPVAGDDMLAAPAGNGWALNPANGHYYRLVASNVSWYAATDAAQSDGAYLATITSQTEQDFVHDLTDGIGGWLGGFSSAAPFLSSWHWSYGPEFGDSFSYSNWNDGEPTGWEYNPPEGLHLEADGGWNDVPADWSAFFVEEWGGRPGDANVGEDSMLTIAASTLLDNDSDPDAGDHPTVLSVSSTSAAGALVTVSGSTISYDPTHAAELQALAAGAIATDTFTYTVGDGHGGTDTATVTLVVAGINDPPDFTGASVGVNYTGTAVGIAAGVSASDIDSANYGGGSLTATVTDGGHEGDRLSIAESQYIHYQASGHIVSFDSDGAGGPAGFVNIGTLTDNFDSLTIALNGNATDDAVARLAQAVQFTNTKPNAAAPGSRTVTFTLNDGDGTDNGGHNTDYFNATVNVGAANQAPVAGNDSFITHSEYIAIASNLTYNDSDPDDDEFHISSLAHGGTVADFDEEFGAYTVQGIYGTLLLFPYETSSVTIGGFVNTHFNAGDFIFVTGKAINGDSLGDLPIYDLQPGQMPPLSDTFTYTVADSHGAESLEAAAITLTFEPSYANLRVQTADGYDTTTLRDDLKYGIITDIDSTCVTVQNGGRTILIDAKELTWSGTVEEENVTLTGGLIKGFHVSDSSVPVFDAVRFNIPAADLDEAVGNSTSTAFDDTLKEYAYDSLGGSGPDVFRGGDLADYIDTGGGADTVTAGNGNDVVTIRDNTAWKIDGGAGIDTIRLDGAFNLTASPEEQNATSIEIVDLKNNSAYANTIVVEPEGVFQINGDHVVRILGTATDTVVLGHDYPGGVGGHWVSGQTEMTYTADYVTQGVLFDRYDYMDVEDQTYATLYVQHGVTVDDGPVVLSENLQTVEGPNGGATVSQLSIADGDVGAALSFTVEAGDGTLALALENEAITLDQDGSNGTLSGTGSLAAINQMLADGVTYAPDLDTPPVTDMVTLTFTDGQGSDTLNFIFNVTGENPVLFGTANKDILYATEGDDQFVFAATTGTGHDTIINFTPGHDDIELDYEAFTTASGPNDFSHWLASHATAVNGDVLIDLNIDGEHLNQDTILLKNVALASLHANDFILSPGGGNVL